MNINWKKHVGFGIVWTATILGERMTPTDFIPLHYLTGVFGILATATFFLYLSELSKAFNSVRGFFSCRKGNSGNVKISLAPSEQDRKKD